MLKKMIIIIEKKKKKTIQVFAYYNNHKKSAAKNSTGFRFSFSISVSVLCVILGQYMVKDFIGVVPKVGSGSLWCVDSKYYQYYKCMTL